MVIDKIKHFFTTIALKIKKKGAEIGYTPILPYPIQTPAMYEAIKHPCRCGKKRILKLIPLTETTSLYHVLCVKCRKDECDCK